MVTNALRAEVWGDTWTLWSLCKTVFRFVLEALAVNVFGHQGGMPTQDAKSPSRTCRTSPMPSVDWNLGSKDEWNLPPWPSPPLPFEPSKQPRKGHTTVCKVMNKEWPRSKGKATRRPQTIPPAFSNPVWGLHPPNGSEAPSPPATKDRGLGESRTRSYDLLRYHRMSCNIYLCNCRSGQSWGVEDKGSCPAPSWDKESPTVERDTSMSYSIHQLKGGGVVWGAESTAPADIGAEQRPCLLTPGDASPDRRLGTSTRWSAVGTHTPSHWTPGV